MGSLEGKIFQWIFWGNYCALGLAEGEVTYPEEIVIDSDQGCGNQAIIADGLEVCGGANLILDRLVKRYRPPHWWRVWILCAVPLSTGVLLITMTQNKAQLPEAPNRLARNFLATAPNQKWLTDNSYVRSGQGWLYLSIVLDLYARLLVGWAIDPYATERLKVKALTKCA